ncbi:30S ribosomal protein S12 methylthiotransferase RimO [Caldicellulosiruptoraceae bacterium PP1]
MINIGFISLGCNKNLVDSEVMMGYCKQYGYNITNNPEQADVIVVNTCGFINDAKEESIDTILDMAEYKKKRCKFLIVTGCLTERYREELVNEMPEIDAAIGIGDLNKLPEIIEKLFNHKKKILSFDNKEFIYNSKMPRVIGTPNFYAYVKIAEGCNNRCSYCSIPLIRGNLRSREIGDIIDEVNFLVSNGYKEIVLTAQDTTKYGLDLYKKRMLTKLLETLNNIDGLKWIRFLYSYPEDIDDELIKIVNKSDKIVNYFDIPIQHINDKILKLMNRKTTSQKIKEVIEKIRNSFSEVVIRTTVMVGFPTETEEQFDELYEFIKLTKFDRLGVFMYSQEEDTKAAELPQVDLDIKAKRFEKIVNLQRRISLNNNKKRIGKTYDIIIEGKDKNNFYIARSQFEAPEVDGKIIAFSKEELKQGQFYTVKIVDAFEYDLVGEVIK